jgi:quercetin dioxygenase-like cupin family protein
MKVVTLKDIPNVPMEGAEPIEGYAGPVSRSRQTIIQPGDSANYNCSVVNFSQGCTTGWHTHNCDQVLVVTSGSGKVATEHEQREINVGDVVHIKAGERHWHGATADTTMGISRSHSLAVKPRTDSLALCSGAWVVPQEGPPAGSSRTKPVP